VGRQQRRRGLPVIAHLAVAWALLQGMGELLALQRSARRRNQH
jgi:hypothetical protein